MTVSRYAHLLYMRMSFVYVHVFHICTTFIYALIFHICVTSVYTHIFYICKCTVYAWLPDMRIYERYAHIRKKTHTQNICAYTKVVNIWKTCSYRKVTQLLYMHIFWIYSKWYVLKKKRDGLWEFLFTPFIL